MRSGSARRGMRRMRGIRRMFLQGRVLFLGLVMMCGLGALVGKLWLEQIVRGPHWAAKVASRSEVTVRIPAVRGEIRDRNGIVLVGNRASYEVDFYLSDIVRGFKRQNGWVPMVKFKAPVHQMLTDKSEPDIVQIVNTSILPRLQQLDLASDYNAERLQKSYRNDTEVPFTYREDLDFATIAKFSENDVGLPGVEVAIRPVRQYVYGALAAHLLGYVGAPLSIQSLPDVKDYTFYQPDVEGKSQIELSMETYLRGTPGVRVLQRSARGTIEEEIRRTPPKPGNNVYLTLDARIQFITEEALRHPAIGRAAALVLDPNSGDILAMVSVPSFDPNIFIPSVSSKDWNALMEDRTVPLVNRAVSGFPPGSVFKIVTALAGLSKNLGKSRFNCPGGIQYGDHYFRCWISDKNRTHGTLGLSDGLKVSCNSFFYQYGNAAGIAAIDHVGELLGLGQRYEIGLSDEKEGCLPGPEWMRLRSTQERWTSAQTANVAIGQGYVLTSPLQIAVAYASVANGGIVYQPRLVKAVRTPKGSPVRDQEGHLALPDQPKIRADLREAFTAEQIEAVRQGLWEVVNETGGPGGGGTGSRGRVEGVSVAGKTGTAQASDLGKEDYVAWFCCFAPFERPRYVVVAMVQSGKHGGSVAAPVVAHILQQCLALDQGRYRVQMKPLAPARSDHPFRMIDALNFKEAAAQLTLAEVDESADQKEPSRSKSQLSHSRGHPDIRSETDSRGKVPLRAIAAKPQTDRNNVFQRFFRPRNPPNPRSAPTPRRSHRTDRH